MSLDEKDLTLEDISINLRLISKIEGGNKLVQNDKYVNIDTSYFPSISRWFKGVSRDTNLEFIKMILNKAFYYNDKMLEDKNDDNVEILLRLTNELKNSIEGLINLKQTYILDKLVQSEIDIMIDNVRIKIDHNSKKLNFNQ
jgi:hypothetical protein